LSGFSNGPEPTERLRQALPQGFEPSPAQNIAKEMIGKQIFMGWPFLQEGLVVAISDLLFKYEKMTVVPSSLPKVVSNLHSPHRI